MKKMKIVTCALLAFSLFNMSAYADTRISLSGNNVTVSVDGSANTWGSLVVLKSGDAYDNENIITMKQAQGDAEGKLVFDFSISDEPGAEKVNAKYDLRIKNGSEDVITEEMYYATLDDREELAKTLRDAASASELTDIIENEENEIVLRALGFDFEKYAVIKSDSNDKKEFADIFIGSVDEDMTDSEQTADVLNKSLLIELINIGSSEDDEYIKELNLSFEKVEYDDIKDEKLKSFITDYINSNVKYSGVDELADAYECANVLYIINNTRFSSIEKTLKKYEDILGIASESEYEDYLDAKNKSDVNETIAKALKASPAESVDDLLSVIEKATDKNSGKTGGGSSGGGGGGGSSSGSVKPSSPTSVTPFVSTEKKQKFSDIDNVPWAEEAINTLSEKGIVIGDENGNFNPDNTVKREEFVKMLVVAANLYNEEASCNFEDIIPGAWYYSYVSSAYNKGLVKGVSEYEFGIGSNITRQDLSVMCYRAAKNVKEIKAVRDKVAFSDESNISDYAREAVDVLYRASVINGVGENEFAPLSAATRAQAAVIIYNLFVK